MEKLYCGIDLHSNNNYIVVSNGNENKLLQKRLPNDLIEVKRILNPFKDRIQGVVVESTYNWYWLVDGLMDAGYKLHLANPAAIKQYEGLKHSDDKADSAWLAHLLCLDILPTGYIYPKWERGIRDLARKRAQMVRLRTINILSIQNIYSRNTGGKIGSNKIKTVTLDEMKGLLSNPDAALAASCNLEMMMALEKQIKRLETEILGRIKLRPEYQKLLTIDGIGKILALTIMLETGEISRFGKAGNYVSYCRCVKSERTSNKKKKGVGNRKNGNKYLSWAFVEAANFAIRFNDKARRFYEKKAAKTKNVVAIKALAAKLSRAAYYIMKNQSEFDENRIFVN